MRAFFNRRGVVLNKPSTLQCFHTQQKRLDAAEHLEALGMQRLQCTHVVTLTMISPQLLKYSTEFKHLYELYTYQEIRNFFQKLTYYHHSRE